MQRTFRNVPDWIPSKVCLKYGSNFRTENKKLERILNELFRNFPAHRKFWRDFAAKASRLNKSQYDPFERFIVDLCFIMEAPYSTGGFPDFEIPPLVEMRVLKDTHREALYLLEKAIAIMSSVKFKKNIFIRRNSALCEAEDLFFRLKNFHRITNDALNLLCAFRAPFGGTHFFLRESKNSEINYFIAAITTWFFQVMKWNPSSFIAILTSKLYGKQIDRTYVRKIQKRHVSDSREATSDSSFSKKNLLMGTQTTEETQAPTISWTETDAPFKSMKYKKGSKILKK